MFNDQDVDLDPLDSDGHSLEFLVKRVDRYVASYWLTELNTDL